jgi:Tol biopolymer transport system component
MSRWTVLLLFAAGCFERHPTGSEYRRDADPPEEEDAGGVDAGEPPSDDAAVTDAGPPDGDVDATPPIDASPRPDAPPRSDAGPPDLSARRIAYLADQDTDGVTELYLSSIGENGPTTPVPLNATLVAGGDVIRFVWSPDGTKILYEADQEVDEVFGTYLVDVSNPTPARPVKLNRLGAGRSAFQAEWSASSKWVAYRGRDGLYAELFVVDASGSTPGLPIRVNTTLPLEGVVEDFAWSPVADRLVYRADQSVKNHQDLWLVELASGPSAPVRVNQPFTAGKVAERGFWGIGWDWSPDGTKLAYRGREEGYPWDLFVVDMNAPGTARKLNEPVANSIGINWFVWSPASDGIAFLAWESDLWVSTLSTRPTFLSTLSTGAVWSPDGGRLAYHVSSNGQPAQLYLIDVAGGVGPPQLVNGPLLSNRAGVVAADRSYDGYFWKPDGTKLLYIADELDRQAELFVVDVSGASPGPRQKVNGPLVSIGGVAAYKGNRWGPDGGRPLYAAPQQVIGKQELHMGDVSGPTPKPSQRVNGTIVRSGSLCQQDTYAKHRWAFDAPKIAYLADQETARVCELYAVTVADTPGAAWKINGPLVSGGNVIDFAWEPPVVVAPAIAPCLTGGNVLHLDGTEDDYIHPGVETITGGTWSGALDGESKVTIELFLRDPFRAWNVRMQSPQDTPLVVGTYEDARRPPSQTASQPGLDVSGDARGCNTLSGRFHVHALTKDTSGELTRLTASFEQHCEMQSAVLRGCVHFER